MESLKWIIGYLKYHIPKYSIALILVLITSLLSMINPFLAGDIVDRVLNGNEKNILIPILIIMLVVVVIKGILTYNVSNDFERVSQDILLNIRKDLYSKLLKLDFDYYNNTKTGDIMARMINPPYETPIGPLTALLGVPMFIYLVRKDTK